MNKFEFNIENKILPWLGRTLKLIDDYMNERLCQEGIELTRVQLLLLIKLHHQDGQSQHSLAFITNRDKASLARLLTTLEKKNLVARIPSKTDGRINHVYLTKHGKETFKQALPTIEKILYEVQEGLSTGEIENIITILNKIQKTIKSHDLVAAQTK